jgi:hypothetical protein
VLHDSAKMKIVSRRGDQTISQAILADRDATGGVVVTGSFAPALLWARLGSDPIPLREWKFDGRVAVRGRQYSIEWVEDDRRHRYAGNSEYARAGALLAFVEGGGNRYRFGIGDVPPRSADGHPVVAGLSALIPMILTNGTSPTLYDGASNWWYGKLAQQDPCGRVIVGYDMAAHRIVVIVQNETGALFSLNDLRDFAKCLGCGYAVGLDGSTSVFLRYQSRWVFRANQGYKDRFNGNAVAFYY